MKRSTRHRDFQQITPTLKSAKSKNEKEAVHEVKRILKRESFMPTGVYIVAEENIPSVIEADCAMS